MSNRGLSLVMTLCLLAFMAWLVLATRPPRGREGGGDGALVSRSVEPAGAAVRRCDEPVRWRVAGVDPRFGVDGAVVESSAREAAALWSEGTGRRLFAMDGAGGIPIRLVYDERQARTDERVRAEDLIRRTDEALAREMAELQRDRNAYHESRARHLDLRADLDAAVAEHNASVQRWNRVGGAPEDTAAVLSGNEARLRGVTAELVDETGRLLAVEEALRVREQAIVDRVSARNAENARLQREFPSVAVESGAYLHAEGTDGWGGAVVLREIRVFRFEDRSALVRVLAHEFGHALGLGHVDEPGAVMNARQGGPGWVAGPLALHPADLLAVEQLCRLAGHRSNP